MTLEERISQQLHQAGIDNFGFSGERLLIGGAAYAYRACQCHGAECSGVELVCVASAEPSVSALH